MMFDGCEEIRSFKKERKLLNPYPITAPSLYLFKREKTKKKTERTGGEREREKRERKEREKRERKERERR